MKALITGGSGFIGTNLIDYLIANEEGISVLNYDKAAPVKHSHHLFWREGNIMDENRFAEVCTEFSPDIIIHLAARTDTLSNQLTDYEENHVGTKHILNVIKKVSSIQRVIVASTQYVYKSEEKPFPDSELDYKPHTVYGQSKVLTEQYTREAELSCVWTIVRPTNIWGPWHMRYPNELWKIIDKGLYFHPVRNEVIRTYGYVKNIAHQIFNIIKADPGVVNQSCFYVGDAPIDSYLWLNGLSLAFAGKKIKTLPKVIFSSVATLGDLLRRFKIPFPLYSERFKNMIEDYPAPTQKTIDLFGVYEKDLAKNIAETSQWLLGEGKVYFEYWKGKKGDQ